MNSTARHIAGWLIAIAAVIALTIPLARNRVSAEQSSEHFQRSFPIAQNGSLHVENYKGTIHIAGTEGNQVVVDVTKRFDGNASDRKWWMEHVEINFQNNQDRVSVQVKYPWNCIFCWESRDYNAAVELEIRVPGQINVTLDSYKPDIKIASIQGDIRVKSYKSPITIDSASGTVRVDTYKDTIKMYNLALHGPLEVKSFKADAEITAKTLGESVVLENNKGAIVLRLPQNAGLDVDYEGGRHSSFHSDFPVESRAGQFGRSFRGTVNQGGTRLRLRTEKGSVSLEKLSGQP